MRCAGEGRANKMVFLPTALYVHVILNTHTVAPSHRIAEERIITAPRESVEGLLERITRSKATRIIVSIPRGASVGSSVHHFHALLQEAERLKKEIVVESVDDHTLELASLAKLRAVNPVFKTRERAVTDIVPRSRIGRTSAPSSAVDAGISHTPVDTYDVSDASTAYQSPSLHRIDGDNAPRSPRRIKGKIIWSVVALITLFIGYELVFYILPRATVTLEVKKYPVTIQETITVSGKTSTVSTSTTPIVIPGELLVSRRTIEKTFTASGREAVTTRSAGTLTVVNTFNSTPQTLVANTRFESPEGKVFRLVERVTVPGTSTVQGTVTPGRVSVRVVADEPGSTYNVASSTGWRIPGFQGTPKYVAFFAEAPLPMTGGASGERGAPTTAELAAARKEVGTALSEALEGELRITLDGSLTLIPGATLFTLTRDEVHVTPSGENTFSVFQEGELRAFVFRAETVRSAIASRVRGTIPSEFAVRTATIRYGTPTVDSAGQSLTVSVEGSMLFEPEMNESAVISTILGANEEKLKTVITSLPGVERARAALWPFWVTNVPNVARRVTITIQ